MGEPLCFGKVKSFQPDKKHGYVVCDSVFNESGQDVYVFQDVLAEGGAGVGDTIGFFVHWSAKGQPQASKPVVRLAASDGAYALKGTFKPGKDGTFGFIECDTTKEISGRDVYVRQDIAGGFEAGQTVKFNVFLNPQQQPNADSLEACPAEWEPEPADLSEAKYADIKGGAKGKGKKGGDKGGWDGGKGGFSWGDMGWDGGKKGGGDKGWGKGGGKDKGGKGKGGGPASPPTGTGKICVGTLKSFNPANNFGFIECQEVKAEYGNDVFVHGRNFESFSATVGMALQFEVGVSQKGQPQALNLQAVDDGTAGGWAEAAIAEAAGAVGYGEPAAKKAKMDAWW